MTTPRLRMVPVLFGCLLAFATSASAEGAWVLWGTYTRTSTGYSHTAPVSSHETLKDCHLAYRLSYAMATGRLTPHDREALTAQGIVITPPDPDVAIYLICLPDTVDPRG